MITNQDDASPTGDDHPAFMCKNYDLTFHISIFQQSLMQFFPYVDYINDGLYGAFNCILYDHQLVTPKVLMKGGNFLFGKTLDEPEYNCFIWGPTCDSIDCITKNGSLPELLPGDWLYFEEMGAYTIAAATRFNGFKKSKVIYTTTEPRVLNVLSLWHLLMKKKEF